MGNFLSAVLQLFRPVKPFHSLINRSRLYNSYESLLEIVTSIINYSVFSITNQYVLLHLFLVTKILTVTANYFAHITNSMRFLFSSIVNGMAVVIVIVLLILLFIRLVNLDNICNLLSDYYTRHPQLDSGSATLCREQKDYYTIWAVLEIVMIVFKGLSIYFALKANNIVKKHIMLKMKKA